MPNNITKLAFTWNADLTMATLKAYTGAGLSWTLTFTWNADGTLLSKVRT